MTRAAGNQELKSTMTEETEMVKQGSREMLLEGRAISETGFYFGFMYKGVGLQFSGSGDGDQ